MIFEYDIGVVSGLTGQIDIHCHFCKTDSNLRLCNSNIICNHNKQNLDCHHDSQERARQ